MSFFSKLTAASGSNHSLLCVGLDPRLDTLPEGENIEDRLTSWGTSIIDQTADLVCCYKPNFAFYEQGGPPGLRALQRTVRHIPEGIPVLLDIKRGDIGSTASAYAAAAYEQWGADAVTLNPYLGKDSIKPFLDVDGKAVFLLCYTSNPSAGSVQEYGYPPLYMHIAHQAQSWGNQDQIGYVVGATQPAALRNVRQLCPENWILAPGVGAQGGDLKEVLRAGLRADRSGLIIPVSRGVIFEPDVHAAADSLRVQINAELEYIQPQFSKEDAFKNELITDLFQAGCVQFGHFTLASGKASPIYIDLRRVVSYPQLFNMIAQAYADAIRPLSYDHIAGVPYAALPAAAVTATMLGASLIYPRKEMKDHGTGRMIEGSYQAGQSAVLLEDVITSGGSIETAADTLQAESLIVRDVVVLVDREQGGRSHMQKRGFDLHALMTITEILDVLKTGGLIDGQTDKEVREYLQRAKTS